MNHSADSSSATPNIVCDSCRHVQRNLWENGRTEPWCPVAESSSIKPNWTTESSSIKSSWTFNICTHRDYTACGWNTSDSECALFQLKTSCPMWLCLLTQIQAHMESKTTPSSWQPVLTEKRPHLWNLQAVQNDPHWRLLLDGAL